MSIPLSLYVHFPWCIKKCPYCDFNSHANTGLLPEEKYLQCLLADLQHDLQYVQNRSLVSIFFGGGTPSLISPQTFDNLLQELHKHLNFANDLEITLETNPGTMERAKLADYHAAGITRISVGAQSFNDQMLAKLGRIHRAADTLRLIDEMHSVNFKSFNLDIMHSLPDQTLEQALNDLEIAIGTGAPHISWYQLTIEANTMFAKYPPVLPNDETMWSISDQGHALLESSGLQQYEISAFAKPSHRCKHNLNYWNFGDYLGIGAGAHGKITDQRTGQVTRMWKTRVPKDYLGRTHDFLAGMGIVGQHDLPEEFMLNQLRLVEGFSAKHFSERTGLPISSIDGILKKAADRGLVTRTQDLIQTTEFGRRFLNDLISMFTKEEITCD